MLKAHEIPTYVPVISRYIYPIKSLNTCICISYIYIFTYLYTCIYSINSQTYLINILMKSSITISWTPLWNPFGENCPSKVSAWHNGANYARRSNGASLVRWVMGSCWNRPQMLFWYIFESINLYYKCVYNDFRNRISDDMVDSF